MPHVVILAGPSGSGKSHLSERLGWTVLRLDDFYHPADHPELPLSTLGIADWDHPGSWDRAAAMRAINELCTVGRTQVPVYDISVSRATGTREVVLTGDRFIAEGLFATEIIDDCREAGVLDAAICLTRPRPLVFALRLARDLRESRKPPVTLVRRGWRLMKDQPRVIAEAVAAGCVPMHPRQAYRALTSR
ncbi:ATP-binding protein [Aeromicrobium senzhongii]|uniref:ATP-binding protein n=1 Tax=Aeromicrobium senzhongii TaxID=2663859 RepID=A0ABX6SRD0_9ACTN|nr:ATP-binding protein [Aeromicrobium senzhongii]MTB88768.1 ATP-binding protein [Aeromicrobium senzhongii]QNL93938.1 ATP-binding protein [Aeromicrobium senzhongii]